MFEKNTLVRRRALERLYDGLCTITQQEKVVDPTDGSTKFDDVVTAENVPCRVSISSSPVAVQGDTSATVNQTITLFLPPEIQIAWGASVNVSQYGVTTDYKCAGQPAVYDVFQSVELELMEDGC